MIQTPWEKNGSPNYNYVTTPEDEATFLAEVVATGRVGVTQIGAAPDGKPINLIRVGATAPPPYAAHPKSGLWVSSQHTRETSPREALLTFLRDMAETTDPTMLGYLAAHPMFLIPTPYPATMGQEATPGVIDHNRDHLQLTHGGTIAIHDVISTVRPQLVQDMHTGGVNDIDIETAHFAGVDSGLRALGQQAALSVRAHLIANGVTSAPLPVNEDLPVTFRNVAGLRGTIALLTEDYGGNLMSRRITVELHALRGVVAWHLANTARISSTQEAAKLRVGQRGANTAPYPLGSAHTRYASAQVGQEPVKTIAPPPSAYRLTGPEHDAIARHRTAFGITTQPDGSGWLVTMNQAASTVIPFIVDPESTESSIKPLATPWRNPRRTLALTGAPESYGQIMIEGTLCNIETVATVLPGGDIRQVWPEPA